MNRILHLTLSKKPFEVMVTGEKSLEFREPSHWLLTRLRKADGIAKEYDFVKFVNGYGADKPYFIAKYKGYYRAEDKHDVEQYSNGLKVNVRSWDIVISLGEIVETGNLPTPLST